MKRVAFSFASLFFVMACAGFSYKWYSADTSRLSDQELAKLKLISGKSTYQNKNGLLCKDNPSSDAPACIVMESIEYRDLLLEYQEMKERLKNCNE